MDLNYNLHREGNVSGHYREVSGPSIDAGTSLWIGSYPSNDQIQQLNSGVGRINLSDTGTNYLDQYMSLAQQNGLSPTTAAPPGQLFVTSVQQAQGNNGLSSLSPNVPPYSPNSGSIPTSPVALPTQMNFSNKFYTPEEINMLTPEQQLALISELQQKVAATGVTPIATVESVNQQMTSPRSMNNKANSLPRGVGNISSYGVDTTDSSPSSSSTHASPRVYVVRSADSTPENGKKRVSLTSETSSSCSSTSVPGSPISAGMPAYVASDESEAKIKATSSFAQTSPAPFVSSGSGITRTHKPAKSSSLKIHTRYPQDKCFKCGKKVYGMEKITGIRGAVFHKSCFKCEICGTQLTLKTYFHNENDLYEVNVYCKSHQPKVVDKGAKLDADSILIKGAMSVPKLNFHNEQVRDVGKSHMDLFSREIAHAQKVPVTNLQTANKFKPTTWSKKGRKKFEQKTRADVKHSDPVNEYDQEKYELYIAEGNPDYTF